MSEHTEMSVPDTGERSAQMEREFSKLVTAVTQLIVHNTEALDRLSAAIGTQNARTEALEKTVRLNTPMSPQQVKCLNAAIRQRARELLAKRSEQDNVQATRKLGNSIRRAVMTRYGVGALNEIPRHEYPVALTHVQTWNDALCVSDAVREAQKRGEKV